MTRQNRVLPTGEIVADPARGMFTGNRGVLHDDHGRIGAARWRHPHWITCVLALPGRPPRPLMAPGRWTELFFLDEAVSLAAGHRPCAYCRREAFARFRAAWAAADLQGHRAPEIDAVLHSARVRRDRRQVTHDADAADLPDGAFVLCRGSPHLVIGPKLLPFEPSGYGAPEPRPSGTVTVLTPAPTIAVLRAGYRPDLHPSALSPRPFRQA
jgi:hypothetical protein